MSGQADFDEVLCSAKRAVWENVRHSHDSLRELLWKWFPEASDQQIDDAVNLAL